MVNYKKTLYACFEKHLFREDFIEQSDDEFITKVADECWNILQQTGSVPTTKESAIKEDLMYDIKEMLLKKTYGFFNLREYRQNGGARSKRPS